MLIETELDRQIAEFFSYNEKTAQLFLHLAFLMQRDMAGGLTTYDIIARESIAHELKKKLSQYEDRHVVNGLIEAIGNSEYNELASIINSQSVRYIAEQDYRSLCEILKTYLSDDIGMLVKIPITDNLDIDKLISGAKDEHPRLAIGVDIEVANPWDIILNPPSIEKYPNHILIAFPVSAEDARSIYYLKGLCMAKVLLTEPEEDEEASPQVERSKTATSIGSLNILKGVLSISNRLFGMKKSKPNSKPFLASDSQYEESVEEQASEASELANISDDSGIGDAEEDLESVGESNLQDDNHLTAGFFDTNHGFFLSIRKRIAD